jgi:hypothetical protein
MENVPCFAARRLDGDRWEIIAPDDDELLAGPPLRRAAVVSPAAKRTIWSDLPITAIARSAGGQGLC